MSGIFPDDLGDPIADAVREMDRVLEEQEQRKQAAAVEAAATSEQQRTESLADVLTIVGALPAEMEDAYSTNTSQLYRYDIRRFQKWCRDEGVSYLPASPADVGGFLLHMAGGIETKSPPWHAIRRMRTAIGYMHQLGQFPNPCDDILVRATMRFLRGCYAKSKTTTVKPNGKGHLDG
jgi:hypothetical protein